MPANFQLQNEPRDFKGRWTRNKGVAKPAPATKKAPPTKAQLAKLTHKPSTKEKQRVADESEAELATALGMPRTKDNAPFDLQTKRIGVEIKTLVDNKNSKVTVHPESRMRKEQAAREYGLTAHMVVIDKRQKQTVYYYADHVGSFRIGSMRKVTISELRRLIKK